MIYRVPSHEGRHIVFVSGHSDMPDGKTRFILEPIHPGASLPLPVDSCPSEPLYSLLMLDVPLFDRRGGPWWCDSIFRAYCENGEWFAAITPSGSNS